MTNSFTTVREIALEAELNELRRENALLKRDGYGVEPEMFLGQPTEIRDMTSPHLEEIRLPKIAEWKVHENFYHVPTMIGRTFDKGSRRLEMTFYCTPHPFARGDNFNIMGELHKRCLQELARMYRDE